MPRGSLVLSAAWGPRGKVEAVMCLRKNRGEGGHATQGLRFAEEKAGSEALGPGGIGTLAGTSSLTRVSAAW